MEKKKIIKITDKSGKISKVTDGKVEINKDRLKR